MGKQMPGHVLRRVAPSSTRTCAKALERMACSLGAAAQTMLISGPCDHVITAPCA